MMKISRFMEPRVTVSLVTALLLLLFSFTQFQSAFAASGHSLFSKTGSLKLSGSWDLPELTMKRLRFTNILGLHGITAGNRFATGDISYEEYTEEIAINMTRIIFTGWLGNEAPALIQELAEEMTKDTVIKAMSKKRATTPEQISNLIERVKSGKSIQEISEELENTRIEVEAADVKDPQSTDLPYTPSRLHSASAQLVGADGAFRDTAMEYRKKFSESIIVVEQATAEQLADALHPEVLESRYEFVYGKKWRSEKRYSDNYQELVDFRNDYLSRKEALKTIISDETAVVLTPPSSADSAVSGISTSGASSGIAPNELIDHIETLPDTNKIKSNWVKVQDKINVYAKHNKLPARNARLLIEGVIGVAINITELVFLVMDIEELSKMSYEKIIADKTSLLAFAGVAVAGLQLLANMTYSAFMMAGVSAGKTALVALNFAGKVLGMVGLAITVVGYFVSHYYYRKARAKAYWKYQASLFERNNVMDTFPSLTTSVVNRGLEDLINTFSYTAKAQFSDVSDFYVADFGKHISINPVPLMLSDGLMTDKGHRKPAVDRLWWRTGWLGAMSYKYNDVHGFWHPKWRYKANIDSSNTDSTCENAFTDAIERLEETKIDLMLTKRQYEELYKGILSTYMRDGRSVCGLDNKELIGILDVYNENHNAYGTYIGSWFDHKCVDDTEVKDYYPPHSYGKGSANKCRTDLGQRAVTNKKVSESDNHVASRAYYLGPEAFYSLNPDADNADGVFVNASMSPANPVIMSRNGIDIKTESGDDLVMLGGFQNLNSKKQSIIETKAGQDTFALTGDFDMGHEAGNAVSSLKIDMGEDPDTVDASVYELSEAKRAALYEHDQLVDYGDEKIHPGLTVRLSPNEEFGEILTEGPHGTPYFGRQLATLHGVERYAMSSYYDKVSLGHQAVVVVNDQAKGVISLPHIGDSPDSERYAAIELTGRNIPILRPDLYGNSSMSFVGHYYYTLEPIEPEELPVFEVDGQSYSPFADLSGSDSLSVLTFTSNEDEQEKYKAYISHPHMTRAEMVDYIATASHYEDKDGPNGYDRLERYENGESTTRQWVSVQLSGKNNLTLAEVEVIDLEGNNLALNRPAYQSSTHSSSTAGSAVASRANDGDTNGNYRGSSVTHTKSDEEAWWNVSVPRTKKVIDHIDVWNRTDDKSERLQSFYVYVTNFDPSGMSVDKLLNTDGVRYYYHEGVANSHTSLPFYTFETVKPKKIPSTQWVTIQLSAKNNLTLAEVEVLDSEGNNLALNRPASQSSTHSSSTAGSAVASRANDGDTNGNYRGSSVTHTKSDEEAWWNVSVPGVVGGIGHINIWNRTDDRSERLQDFYVYITDFDPSGKSVDQLLNTGGVSYHYHEGIADTTTSLSINEFTTTIMSEPETESKSQWVSVQLTGEDYLALAEVEVIDSEGNNLAPSGTANQSSIYRSTTAGAAFAPRANDGDTDGNYRNSSVAHTLKNKEAWWNVSLPSVEGGEISSVNIWNRTDGNYSGRLKDFYVYITDFDPSGMSVDKLLNIEGVRYYFHEGRAETRTTLPLSVFEVHEPSSKKWVTVQLTGIEPLALAEVRVIGYDGINHAKYEPADQSSTYTSSTKGSAYPGRANDGVTNGNYYVGSVSLTKPSKEAWWGVSLPDIKGGISHIEIYNRTDMQSERLKDFYVYVTDFDPNGKSVDELLNTDDVRYYFHEGKAGSEVSLPFSEFATARRKVPKWITVQLRDTNYLSLAEVEIIDSRGVNIALDEAATQSSTYSHVLKPVASRATDGNTSGSFGDRSVTQTNIETEASWRVYLPDVEFGIDHIRVWNRTDGVADRLNKFFIHITDFDPTGMSNVEILETYGVLTRYVGGRAATPTEVSISDFTLQ